MARTRAAPGAWAKNKPYGSTSSSSSSKGRPSLPSTRSTRPVSGRSEAVGDDPHHLVGCCSLGVGGRHGGDDLLFPQPVGHSDVGSQQRPLAHGVAEGAVEEYESGFAGAVDGRLVGLHHHREAIVVQGVDVTFGHLDALGDVAGRPEPAARHRRLDDVVVRRWCPPPTGGAQVVGTMGIPSAARSAR